MWIDIIDCGVYFAASLFIRRKVNSSASSWFVGVARRIPVFASVFAPRMGSLPKGMFLSRTLTSHTASPPLSRKPSKAVQLSRGATREQKSAYKATEPHIKKWMRVWVPPVDSGVNFLLNRLLPRFSNHTHSRHATSSD